jgi:hypothetical protein
MRWIAEYVPSALLVIGCDCRNIRHLPRNSTHRKRFAAAVQGMQQDLQRKQYIAGHRLPGRALSEQVCARQLTAHPHTLRSTTAQPAGSRRIHQAH